MYSGLFFFSGNGSGGTSLINYGITTPTPYTSNVYGNRSGFSISYELQILRKTKSGLLYGAGLSYDQLKSNIKINKVQFNPEVVVFNQSYIYDADGNTSLKNTYFTVNPFIGKRFLKNKVTVNL